MTVFGNSISGYKIFYIELIALFFIFFMSLYLFGFGYGEHVQGIPQFFFPGILHPH